MALVSYKSTPKKKSKNSKKSKQKSKRKSQKKVNIARRKRYAKLYANCGDGKRGRCRRSKGPQSKNCRKPRAGFCSVRKEVLLARRRKRYKSKKK